MVTSILFSVMAISTFFTGFIGTSWHLGTFRERFQSDKEHNITMLINFSLCLIISLYCIVN